MPFLRGTRGAGGQLPAGLVARNRLLSSKKIVAIDRRGFKWGSAQDTELQGDDDLCSTRMTNLSTGGSNEGEKGAKVGMVSMK